MDAKQPPSQCRVPLRLELYPLAVKKEIANLEVEGEAAEKNETATASGEGPATGPASKKLCAGDKVMVNGTCTTPKPGQVHTCKPGDETDCAAMCAKDDKDSCVRLGQLYDFGINGATRDVKKAVDAYTKACSGGKPKGCSQLATMYEAAQFYNRTCTTFNMPEAIAKAACAKAGQLYEKTDPGAAGKAYAYGCQFKNDASVCGKAGALLEKANPAQAARLYRWQCNIKKDKAACAKADKLKAPPGPPPTSSAKK